MFIEGTDYFLTSSLSKNGVNRFKLGTMDSYSQLKFDSIPLGLDTTDLLVIPRAKFALLSYTNYNNIILFDFVEMRFQKSININSGLLAPLDADQSKARFVVSNE